MNARGLRQKATKRLWATSERLNRRTCPSDSCGVVGQLFFREGVTVHEQRDRWARITQPYDASWVGGRSEYVDTGNAACDPANGITEGQFAEWVSTAYLSETRPPDPAAGAAGIEALLAGSDDFARYRTAFAEAAQSLIAQRRCTERDFRDMGGWVKSTNHRNQPIYLTGHGHAQFAHGGEIRQAHLARRADLPENDFLFGAMLGVPGAYPCEGLQQEAAKPKVEQYEAKVTKFKKPL